MKQSSPIFRSQPPSRPAPWIYCEIDLAPSVTAEDPRDRWRAGLRRDVFGFRGVLVSTWTGTRARPVDVDFARRAAHLSDMHPRFHSGDRRRGRDLSRN